MQYSFDVFNAESLPIQLFVHENLLIFSFENVLGTEKKESTGIHLQCNPVYQQNQSFLKG